MTKTVKIDLTPGKHHLRFDYYEKTADARVTFDCDKDLLTWVEYE